MNPPDREVARSRWMFREYEPVGVELGTAESVASYDVRQGTDPAADDALLDRLGVGPGDVLVDLACGTGSLVVQAARRGAIAHGVDVSPEMLRFARRTAAHAGVDAHWHHAGFLDHDYPTTPADVITSKSALHQLPDMWKQQALCRAAAALRPGGRFYLWDAVFSFDPADAETELQHWVDAAAGTTGFTPADFETHIREEYSTYAWVIEGMLTRAGLDVVERRFPRATHAEFVCRRRAEPGHASRSQQPPAVGPRWWLGGSASWPMSFQQRVGRPSDKEQSNRHRTP